MLVTRHPTLAVARASARLLSRPLRHRPLIAALPRSSDRPGAGVEFRRPPAFTLPGPDLRAARYLAQSSH